MKTYNFSDYRNRTLATPQNIKVGDVVDVAHMGSKAMYVCDGIVTKVTSTTIHVTTNESVYLAGKNLNLHKIFRQHTRPCVSFEDGRDSLYVKA